MQTTFGLTISHTVFCEWWILLHWFGWAALDNTIYHNDFILEGSFQIKKKEILPSTLSKPGSLQPSVHSFVSSHWNIATEPSPLSASVRSGIVSVSSVHLLSKASKHYISPFSDISPTSAIYISMEESQAIYSVIYSSMFFSIWEGSTLPSTLLDPSTRLSEISFENRTLDFVNSTEVNRVERIGVPEYTTAEIFGISCGIALLVFAIAAVVFWLYRRNQNPSSSRTNLAKYIQNNITISYINGHIELPDDNLSDGIISLDNDSFLNSLDSSSFTNMWTARNGKHHTHF